MAMGYQYDKRVGEHVRRAREKKGLTQAQLAARLQVRGCDLTRSALAKIEAGQRHVYALEIKVLKEVLGVTFDDLLP